VAGKPELPVSITDRPIIAQEFPVSKPEVAQEFPVSKPEVAQEFPVSKPEVAQEFPVQRNPSRPPICSQTFNLSRPSRITSPNFPGRYLDNEFCQFRFETSRNDICFVKLDFITFVLRR
jgi:hypothetical protein